MAYIDVVYEDCNTEEGSYRLQQAVHKCKPFRKALPDEIIPFEKLEKLVGLYCQKYGIRVQWIRANYSSISQGPRILGDYHAEVSREKPYTPIIEIGAFSMYELYAKLCVAIRWAVGTGKAS